MMLRGFAICGVPVAALITSAAALGGKNRPVTKVINLLQNMQSQLEADQEQDNQIKAKFDCWAKSAMKTTNDVIQTSRKEIKQAENVIANAKANAGSAEARIANLKDELQNLRQSMKDGRTKEESRVQAYFKEHGQNEKDLIGLKQARLALSNIPGQELSLMATSSAQEAVAFARRVFKSVVFNTGQTIPEVVSFLSEDNSDSMAPGSKSYNSQSGKIVGIIDALITDISKNSGEAIREHKAQSEAFGAMMKEKTSVEKNKSALLASDKSVAAEASKKLDDAKKQIIVSTEALDNGMLYKNALNGRIANMNTQMSKRTTSRNEELKAIRGVLAMLSSDDSRKLFEQTIASEGAIEVSFLQRSMTSTTARRASALRLLSQVSARLNSHSLETLQAVVQVADRFDAIYKAIDNNVANMKAKMNLESEARDGCNADFSQNELDAQEAKNGKAAAQQQSDAMAEDVARTKEELALSQQEVADMQTEILRFSAEREDENTEFQKVVKDQRETVQILKKVMTRLREVYKPNAAALVQHHEQQFARPQGVNQQGQGFETIPYQQNEGSNGVLFLIEKIAQDSQHMIDEAMGTEKESQAAYETMVMQTNGNIASQQNKIIGLKDQKASSEGGKAEQDSLVKRETERLGDLKFVNDNLHASCDFLIKHFDTRQQSQQDEIGAMQAAKHMLLGQTI